MCGIAGYLSFAAPPPAGDPLVAGMIRSVRHRGPNGVATCVAGQAALGHARLSIIDLEGGAQPMSSPDGRHRIVFNGEIYNFRSLREELAGQGRPFSTSSDTEVLLAAYERWGGDCVHHLRGMYAFAVHDLREGTLFLARDPLGIKPLVWFRCSEALVFASEIQALRCHPLFPRGIDPDAIDDYLALQYIPAPRTIYRGVAKLPPGHRLTVRRDGTTAGPERYWNPPVDPDRTLDAASACELVEEALVDSVRSHLVADVPFGAFCSGGIDSTLVLMLMARELGKGVKAFSIGFHEADFDESSWAAEAAAAAGAELVLEHARPDALALLAELVRHHGEPFADSSSLATWHVARLARASVPMVLSGDGGDELFAGYHSYPAWLDHLRRGDDRPLWRRFARRVAEVLRPRRYPPHRPGLELAQNWHDFAAVVPWWLRSGMWRPEHAGRFHRVPPQVERAWQRSRGRHPLTRAQLCDLETYLPDSILAKVDIASMMHGLEVRVPILDQRVMEAAARIPPELLLGTGPDGQPTGKRPLKAILERSLPERFVHRRKQGFSVPLQHWMAGNPAWQEAIDGRLLASTGPLRTWFRPEGIARVVREGGSSAAWTLLVLDEWMRQEKAG